MKGKDRLDNMKLLLRFSYVDRKLRDFKQIADVKENEVLKLGRVQESNDVVLKSTSVSRQHATIRVRNGVLQVRDSGSFNGTFLEKTKLTKNDGYVEVIGWRVHEDDGKRYFRIRNPHNRTRLSKS